MYLIVELFYILCRSYLIIIKKLILKTYPPPKVGVLNVEFKLRIYRSLKSLICLKNEFKRSFPQHCILSSTTLHSRSVPLKDSVIGHEVMYGYSPFNHNKTQINFFKTKKKIC